MIDAKTIELIKAYAAENMSMCRDRILDDPLLHGGKWTEENCLASEDSSIHSLIHSSKYHAARDILELCGVNTDDI